MKEIEQTRNEETELIIDFMINNGFNPENYENILELFQSTRDSLSIHLKKYNQFLLSSKVIYSDLKNYDIKGANGYLTNYHGIVIPKELDTRIIKKDNPDISQFQSIIAYHNFELNDLDQLIATSYYPADLFLTLSVDKDECSKYRKEVTYYNLLEFINSQSKNEYKIVHDTISEKNKELFLIKKI